MVKSHRYVYEVLDQDADHPNLLISDSATLSLVHAILAERTHEACLMVIDHCLVQVLQLALIRTVNARGWVSDVTEDRSQCSKVLFEIRLQLVEIGHSARHSLHQLSVSFDRVLLARVFSAVQSEQLEVRLAISHLCGSQEHRLSLVKVARDAEALHVKDAHPVRAHETPLLSAHVIEASGFVFVILLLCGFRVCEIGLIS